jgi:GNAT superfamily N-acetyltransferase
VTRGNWNDFVALFEARGGPHFCWCSVYRFPGREKMGDDEKKRRMRRLVTGSVPIGVLAYDGDVPIGWCSIAPRETYATLERSRTLPRVTPPEISTWTVLCFFVPRPHRGRGVMRALLRGAVEAAREGGADVIEGYPFDSAGITSTHRGHSSIFKAAGFRRDGRRWFLDLAR